MGKTPGGEEILYYNSYDVTSLLREDNNALGALNYTLAEKKFLCQLTVFYTDGSKEVVLNSARDVESFKALDGKDVFGANQSIGTNYFKAEAENINASLYPFGFESVGLLDARPSAGRYGNGRQPPSGALSERSRDPL